MKRFIKHPSRATVTFLRLALSLLTVATYVPTRAADLSPSTIQCLFEKPIAFGASVTQATTAMIPGYRGLVRGVEFYGDRYGTPSKTALPHASRPYGWSPIRYVTKAFAGKSALSNIAYVGSYVTNKTEQLGSAQIDALLGGSQNELYQSSRLLVGVDAFYWDAVWNRCASGEPVRQLKRLVESAKAGGKTLILGNVPIENAELVRIASNRTSVQGLWYPPVPSCANEINAALAASCTPENRCYLLDMQSMVEHLASGGKVSVFGHGEYGYFDLRPDGVHLSDVGSRFLAETMIEALREHPPKCERTQP